MRALIGQKPMLYQIKHRKKPVLLFFTTRGTKNLYYKNLSRLLSRLLDCDKTLPAFDITREM